MTDLSFDDLVSERNGEFVSRVTELNVEGLYARHLTSGDSISIDIKNLKETLSFDEILGLNNAIESLDLGNGVHDFQIDSLKARFTGDEAHTLGGISVSITGTVNIQNGEIISLDNVLWSAAQPDVFDFLPLTASHRSSVGNLATIFGGLPQYIGLASPFNIYIDGSAPVDGTPSVGGAPSSGSAASGFGPTGNEVFDFDLGSSYEFEDYSSIPPDALVDLDVDYDLGSVFDPPEAGFNDSGLAASQPGMSLFVDHDTLNSGPPSVGFTGGGLADVIVDGIQPGAQIPTEFDFDLSIAEGTSAYRTFLESLEYDLGTDNMGLFDAGRVDWGVEYDLGTSFSTFQSGLASRPVDPLVIDIDNDGIVLSGLEDSGVSFDVDADGYAERTGWMSARDGLLVWDRNDNGRIDDQSEVVSERMLAGATTSADALAHFDSNGDGRVTTADSAFSKLLVWRDANSNGKSEAGELFSLATLGIAAIDLTVRAASGVVAAGNAVTGALRVARTDGTETTAAIVSFNADEHGVAITAEAVGLTSLSEDGTRSVSILDPAGAAVDLGARGASIGHGGIGNDTLIGSDAADLLAGHQGRDVIRGGAGDDWIVVDGDDDLSAIDGGDGRDMIQFVGAGDRTLILNLAALNAEAFTGSAGREIVFAGGSENYVLDMGAGHDLAFGGSADDIINGGDGDDFLGGAGGDDVVRGHRGADILTGGLGNDWLSGGADTDRLAGGAGDDLLEGGQGDDVLNGGAGFDVVTLQGSRDDYRFERDGDSWRVTDTVEGRDGTDLLRNIEAVNFADVGRVTLADARPIPVADAIPLDGTGPVVIAAADLLANDIDFQGDALRIVAVENAVGGTAALRADGTILFTPDPDHVGLPAFSYRIEDAAGNRAVEVRFRRDSGDEIAELRGQVTLTPATLPTDERIADQWHLHAVNAPAVWPDYTGDGVTVGVFEVPESYQGTLPEHSRGSGFADFRHPDLAPNMDQALHENRPQPENYSRHATEAAGVIGAARDGAGAVGVAYDVDLVSDEVPIGPTDKLQDLQHYDIANNSWGATEPFSDNFASNPADVSAFEDAVTFGRGGLGTAIVFAAGNDRQDGARSDAKGRQSSRYAINVAAINAPGDLGALQPETQLFSEPGASLLVAAPGSDITTTSVRLETDQGTVVNDGFVATQGTSFAAPVVSGVIALMLEANPDLGYRDIQEILALSARLVDDPTTAWLPNGAAVWNGGGLSFSHDYGFGLVDAKAAVRLAETWTRQGTRANLHTVALSTGPLDRAIPDGGSLTETLTLDPGVSIEHVELRIDLEHEQAGDLVIRLVSPDGTRSVLLDREGRGADATASDRGAEALDGPVLFTSTNHWGELSGGDWTVEITDAAGGQVGTVRGLELRAHGKPADGNDIHVFTNEYSETTGSGRDRLADAGGHDVLNATAVDGDRASSRMQEAASPRHWVGV